MMARENMMTGHTWVLHSSLESKGVSTLTESQPEDRKGGGLPMFSSEEGEWIQVRPNNRCPWYTLGFHTGDTSKEKTGVAHWGKCCRQTPDAGSQINRGVNLLFAKLIQQFPPPFLVQCSVTFLCLPPNYQMHICIWSHIFLRLGEVDKVLSEIAFKIK